MATALEDKLAGAAAEQDVAKLVAQTAEQTALVLVARTADEGGWRAAPAASSDVA